MDSSLSMDDFPDGWKHTAEEMFSNETPDFPIDPSSKILPKVGLDLDSVDQQKIMAEYIWKLQELKNYSEMTLSLSTELLDMLIPSQQTSPCIQQLGMENNSVSRGMVSSNKRKRQSSVEEATEDEDCTDHSWLNPDLEKEMEQAVGVAKMEDCFSSHVRAIIFHTLISSKHFQFIEWDSDGINMLAHNKSHVQSALQYFFSKYVRLYNDIKAVKSWLNAQKRGRGQFWKNLNASTFYQGQSLDSIIPPSSWKNKKSKRAKLLANNTLK